jgi:hypothetical protein
MQTKKRAWITVREVAELLRLNQHIVMGRFEDGTHPGKKIGSKGRCTTKDLEAYLEPPH